MRKSSLLRNTLFALALGFVLPGVSLAGSAPPLNDICDLAIPVSMGSFTTGSTFNATAETAPMCVTSTQPGVWYSFLGTGDFVSVDTCNDSSDYDTKLSVFTGSCDSLVCVIGGDDSDCSEDGLLSVLVFPTTEGTVYRILVHGFSGERGNFGLTVQEAPFDEGGRAFVDSQFSQDANILESRTTPGSGGSFLLANRRVTVGDLADNREQRGLFGFPTTIDGFILTESALRLTVDAKAGDLSGLGDLIVDFDSGFGASFSPELADFNVPPLVTEVARIPNADIVAAAVGEAIEAPLDFGGFDALQLMGNAQFRLRFENGTDSDNSPDSISFGSGSHSFSNRHLRSDLVIDYLLDTLDGCGENYSASRGGSLLLDPIYSTASLDGYVVESHANSGVGLQTDNASTTFEVGDTAADQAVAGMLSFDTAILNNQYPGASIVDGTVCFSLSSTSGSPTSSSLRLEMACPNQAQWLGPTRAVEREDFESYTWLTLDTKVFSRGRGFETVCFDLSDEALAALNRSGQTQFRVVLNDGDSDGNGVRDVFRFFSGSAAANKPVLNVEIVP